MKTTVEQTARSVVQLAQKADSKFPIDPATIILIIKLITMAVSALEKCKKDKYKVIKNMRRPSIFSQFALWRLISKNCPCGQRYVIYSSMIKTSQMMSEKDACDILEDCKRR